MSGPVTMFFRGQRNPLFKCQNCRFSAVSGGQAARTRCRIEDPSRWEVVDPSDWCGRGDMTPYVMSEDGLMANGITKQIVLRRRTFT